MVNDATRHVTFGVYLVTFVLFVLAFSTPWWIQNGSANTGSSQGLWMSCYKTVFNDKWQCSGLNLKNTDTKTRVTQAMMCLALVANVAALGFFFIWVVKKNDDRKAFGAAGACLFGGLLNLTAVAVYGDHWSDWGSFGWSFILACISTSLGILDGAAALLLLVSSRR